MSLASGIYDRGARRWLATARDAIVGVEQDVTQGSLTHAITILAIPMVLEMVMESIFAVADVFFVGRLGSEAVAAVGLTESLLTMVYALGLGLAAPTTAMVARRIGEKNRKAAANVAVQANAIGLALGGIMGVAGAMLAPSLLRLMGASAAVVEVGGPYAALLLGTNTVILLLFLNNAVLRGAGDPALSLRALWLANGINIVLDPCLIFGLGPFPELGLTGAAVATTLGRGIGVVYQMVALGRGRGKIRISRERLRFDPAVIARLLRLSIGGVGQNVVATASWIGLVRILATFGSSAVAGYTIAIRVLLFVLLPSWGLSNAAATLVGQNLGARKPDRAQRSVLLTGSYNMVFLGAVTLVFVAIPDLVVSLFTDDPVVLAIGADCLEIISYGFIFYAWEMVAVQAFNGAGDTTTPTWINLVCFWACQIPLAYVLSHLTPMGENGVFTAVAISYSLSAVIGMWLFLKGGWKAREI
jgi:putative MATE family efflux protein